MGNRAVITTKQGFLCKENNLGVYLHWNGGRDSVEAFLTYCKMQGYRSPESDNYGWVCLCSVIHNFMQDGLSCGIDIVNRLDLNNGDNGVYIIENWEIVDRKFFDGRPEQDQYKLLDFLVELDWRQPRKVRLGKEKIYDMLFNKK